VSPGGTGYTLSPFTPTVPTNFNTRNQLMLQAMYDTAGNQTNDGLTLRRSTPPDGW
jgi:hypothetical protein